MVTIVYESNSGFTKKYAELLAADIKADCFSLDEAKEKLAAGKPVVFLGWISAGIIRGCRKARKLFDVKAVAGVGMAAGSDKILSDLVRQNKLEGVRNFYLRGGFDLAKLKGFYKFIMKLGAAAVVKSLEKKENLTPQESEQLSDFKYGSDHVSKENLADMIAYCKSL
jgi:hypothetical protein